MAQIQNSQLPFNDSATNGNVVDQTAWNQAMQVIQAAVNDNFYRRLADVKVLNADGTLNTTATLQASQSITNELEMQMGSGITITPTVSNGAITLQFSVANGALTGSQLANLTVTAQQIANQTITATQIANKTITNGQIANNTITETQMAAGSIGTTELQNSAVTTAKIANGAVGSTQIASKGVAQSNIADGAVGTNQLDPALLNTTTLNQHRTLNPIDHPDGSVTASKLAYDAVNPTMLQTRVSPNLVDNAHFENVTSTATVFSDALTSYSGSTVPAPWTLQSGSFTFGASGATSGASGSLMTAGNAVWKPILGSDGTTKLGLKATTTFTMPATLPAIEAQLLLWSDTNNYLVAKLYNQNAQLQGSVAGTYKSYNSVAFTVTAGSAYTLDLSYLSDGSITADFYNGTSATGTPALTINNTETDLENSGFLIGVGGDTGVVISNASCVGPFADGWTISGDSRVAWGLTQNAISGKYSVSAVGVGGIGGNINQSTNVASSLAYSLSAYTNTQSVGASGAQIFGQWYNGGTFLQNDLSSTVTGTNSTSRVSKSSTSPSTATKCIVVLAVNDSGTVTFDNIQLEQGSTATPFIPKVQRPATPLDLDPASTIGLANIVRALSGGYKVQSGSFTVTATANTVGSQVLTFPTSFASGTTPIVVAFMEGSNIARGDFVEAEAGGIPSQAWTVYWSFANAGSKSIGWIAIGQ